MLINIDKSKSSMFFKPDMLSCQGRGAWKEPHSGSFVYIIHYKHHMFIFLIQMVGEIVCRLFDL